MSGEQVSASLLLRRRELAAEGYREGRWSAATLAGSHDMATLVDLGPSDAEWCEFLDRIEAVVSRPMGPRLHVVE
jgi:hypothetical protein